MKHCMVPSAGEPASGPPRCSMESLIPAELVYNIMDFLWADPWTLLNCALTCRTWRDASRRLLKRGSGIHIRDFDDLERVSRLLGSRKTRHFYKHLGQLYIHDDQAKPFAHVLPFRLPGTLLPNVHVVGLSRIDWTTRKPHPTLFLLKAAFTSVIDLSVSRSRFRNIADLRQLICAYRNIVALELDAVAVSSAGPRHVHSQKNVPNVKWLRLEGLHLDTIAKAGNTVLGHPAFVDPLLEFCLIFTSLTILHVRNCPFRRFEDVGRFLCSFPNLEAVKLIDNTWDVPNTRYAMFIPPSTSERINLPKLTAFSGRFKSPAQGDRWLQWIIDNLPGPSITNLYITSCNTSPLIGRTLRALGSGLQGNMLKTVAHDGNMASSHTSYTFLPEVLRIDIDMQRDTLDLLLTRWAMLRALQVLQADGPTIRRIRFRLSIENRALISADDTPAAGTNVTMHTSMNVTARPAFSHLEGFAVEFKEHPSAGHMAIPTVEMAVQGIRQLFPDWDARGILEFSLPSGHMASGSSTNDQDEGEWNPWD